MLCSCVAGYMFAIEMMALTREIKEERAGLRGENWVRRIVGVKRADRRRMNELRVEVGVKESCKMT